MLHILLVQVYIIIEKNTESFSRWTFLLKFPPFTLKSNFWILSFDSSCGKKDITDKPTAFRFLFKNLKICGPYCSET